MLSMRWTTSSASSMLKHIGGLNLMTLSHGPSVLMQILCSFNLKHTRTWLVQHSSSAQRLESRGAGFMMWQEETFDISPVLYLCTRWAAIPVAGVLVSLFSTISTPTNNPTPLLTRSFFLRNTFTFARNQRVTWSNLHSGNLFLSRI